MTIRTSLAHAWAVSLAWHLLAFAALVWLMARPRPPQADGVTRDQTAARLVWLAVPGPGGGGGGGGNRSKQPPGRAALPGSDALTVPAEPRPAVQPQPQRPEPAPAPSIAIPVQSMASALDSLPGALTPPAAPTTSQGPGTGGGAGDGLGSGAGPGRGPGLGPGFGGNTGGEGYRIGSGVASPIEIRRGVPQYTPDAMRARIQGSFIIECVVSTDGICTNIRILRAIEPSFGLTDQAIKAAQQWRFRPGTLRGEPVPVRVTLEIGFALR